MATEVWTEYKVGIPVGAQGAGVGAVVAGVEKGDPEVTVGRGAGGAGAGTGVMEGSGVGALIGAGSLIDFLQGWMMLLLWMITTWTLLRVSTE